MPNLASLLKYKSGCVIHNIFMFINFILFSPSSLSIFLSLSFSFPWFLSHYNFFSYIPFFPHVTSHAFFTLFTFSPSTLLLFVCLLFHSSFFILSLLSFFVARTSLVRSHCTAVFKCKNFALIKSFLPA